MTTTIAHWVNNEGFAGNSSATAPVTNPATGAVTGEVALASVEDARAVIDAAAAAFPEWRDTSLAKRTTILFKFRELLNERKGELAEIGFYDRDDTVMVSSVFAEDENAQDVSRYQLATMTNYVSKYKN